MNASVTFEQNDFSGLDDDAASAMPSRDPDVLLDVPLLKVDEIDLAVEDLRAKVSLQADVLDLLNLSVGADVTLGKVELQIKGVEAQALLKVRLDRVAEIINRVLTTIDRNPQLVERLVAGVANTAEHVGAGARQSLVDVGRGARQAVGEVGAGAGRSLRDVGEGTRHAVADLGSAGADTTRPIAEAAGLAGQVVGQAARDRDTEAADEDSDLRSAGVSDRDGLRGWKERDRKPQRPVQRRRADDDERTGAQQARRRPP